MINCDREFGNTAGGGLSRSNTIDLNKSRYTTLSTPNDSCNLSIMHANCQSAMNKRSEISALIDSHNPLILALTEFGAGTNVNDGELGIQGYSLY